MSDVRLSTSSSQPLPRFGGRGAAWLLDRWTMPLLMVAALVSAPVVVVVLHLLVSSAEVWAHLAQTVLPTYILNSLALMLGVGAGVLVIGVGTAWLVTMLRFPGATVFEWALLLPLAIPAYVIAYTYTGLLDFAGPVQSGLRALMGWKSARDYWFPPVRSLGGAITMLTLVLYPYVYMLARAAFLEQSVCALEAGRTLGCGPWRCFRSVALPLARPAIVGGLALALMETLNDFGTVQYFAVDTFTTGIYRTWLGLGQQAVAAQLGALLMLFIFALVLLERWSRGRARFHHTTSRYRRLPRPRLRGVRALLATLACLLPVLLGFVLPAAVLARWAVVTAEESVNARFLALVGNSLLLASVTAVLAVVVALLMAYAHRLRPTRPAAAAVRIASLGYAVPGSVIAVGALVPLAWFDNTLDAAMRHYLGVSSGLLFTGTIAALIYAYVVRFLAVSVNTVEASLAKITKGMEGAARTLGHGPLATLWRVHVPVMRGSILTAALLVFVDVMKELPATLIMRPFNFDTLAVQAFTLAADERLPEAAPAALAIVVAGILPVMLLSAAIARSRPGQ